jgi:hypothetical protein
MPSQRSKRVKLKLDEHGHVVVQDGRPIYIHDDGKEIPFDAAATVTKIGQLNREAQTHREAKETAETALKLFDGIDASAARKALETVKNLDDKKLVDAGEVQKVKDETIKAYDEKLIGVRKEFEPVVAERDSLRAALHGEKIGNAFSRSKFIADKLAIPADMVQAAFGSTFKIEGEHIVAVGKDGGKIYSRAKPGELASFDEALEIMVDAYPNKDTILKGSGARGGGAGGGGRGGDSKSITRAAFDGLDPAAKAAHVKAGGTVVDA